MDLSIYDKTYDQFCDLLSQGKTTILEIGCGPGNITRYLTNKLPQTSILATDVSPQMVNYAKDNVPKAIFKVIDAREIATIGSHFNGIMCGFCVPYLAMEDLSKLINDCNILLNSNGILYLSAIEGNYTDSNYEYSSDGKLKTFVHYYSETDLKNELMKNKFSLIDIIRIPYQKKDGSKQFHLIVIASKKE